MYWDRTVYFGNRTESTNKPVWVTLKVKGKGKAVMLQA
jgi:hypothetical protein